MSQSADPVLDEVSFRCNPNRCKFRQMQVQTDSDRCIAQNCINTEMNERQTGKQADRQTNSEFSQQIQTTADSDSRFRQTAAVSQQIADAGSTYSDSRRTYSGRQ
ncbi:hypothetical protein Tco_0437688 [Tanacetum coccineum]